MSARHALLRLARRDADRNRRRTFLMLLLIALPIAGSALAATLFTTLRVTGDDEARAALGSADLALTADPSVDLDAAWLAARALLGSVSDVEPVAVRSQVLGSETAQLPAAVWAADRHGTTRAMLQLVAGRWPDRRGELLLTPAVAGELGVRVGATVELDGRPHALVGIARDRLDLDRRLGVTTLDGAVPTTLFVQLGAGNDIDPATVAALEELGLRPALRSTVGASSSGEAVVGIVLLGGLAIAVVALVAAAAFAVIAEQRQHELARLRAVGATPRQLRSAVTASGWVYGAFGSLAAVLVSVCSVFMVRGWLERLLGRAIAEVRVPWPALVAIAIVGVLTGVGAARAPARRARRWRATWRPGRGNDCPWRGSSWA